ncbi:conserved cytosolic protein [Clostridium tetani E88]|uniref:Conserved cytosolic protein n=2 Tax=Clostridium tetani TaxID=1513 RepID=Q892R6_CLOTE|nr:conserved cytosolic protein [Clostridium tetani E88]
MKEGTDMVLKEQLQEHWKQALKSGDKFKANTISMVRSSILLEEKNNGKELNDEDVIGVLAKEVKQRREALLEFKKGGRQDLVEEAQSEIEILLSYLPQQLSVEEIKDFVNQAVEKVGANNIKDMGKVMGIVVPKLKGRADGKLVSEVVKEVLIGKNK